MSLSIRKDTDTYKATQVGKVAGLGVGAAHILKNKEDIFVNTIRTSVEQFGTKRNGIIGAVLASAVALIVTTGIGAFAGKFIGMISDKMKFKKALENAENSVVKVDFTAPVFKDIKK